MKIRISQEAQGGGRFLTHEVELKVPVLDRIGEKLLTLLDKIEQKLDQEEQE